MKPYELTSEKLVGGAVDCVWKLVGRLLTRKKAFYGVVDKVWIHYCREKVVLTAFEITPTRETFAHRIGGGYKRPDEDIDVIGISFEVSPNMHVKSIAVTIRCPDGCDVRSVPLELREQELA